MNRVITSVGVGPTHPRFLASSLPEKQPPPGLKPRATGERISLEINTRTVTFNGTPYQIEDSKTFSLYKEIVDNKPQPLTRLPS
jgi:hypothetical protein